MFANSNIAIDHDIRSSIRTVKTFQLKNDDGNCKIKGLFNDNVAGVNDVVDDIKEGVAISLIAKMAHRGERG